MARHRIVRTMNYEDEYYDEEDDLSRSVEDNYCISPSTAAQFTWNREKSHVFAAYMEKGVINEEEETEDSSVHEDSLQDTSLQLSELDQARLNSCLEEARSIIGDSIPESVVRDVVVKNNFNLEASINELLTQQDAPKPQREPRQRKTRSQDVVDLDRFFFEIEADDKHSFTKNSTQELNTHLKPNDKMAAAIGKDFNLTNVDKLARKDVSNFSGNLYNGRVNLSTSPQSVISLSDLVKQSRPTESSNINSQNSQIKLSSVGPSLSDLVKQSRPTESSNINSQSNQIKLSSVGPSLSDLVKQSRPTESSSINSQSNQIKLSSVGPSLSDLVKQSRPTESSNINSQSSQIKLSSVGPSLSDLVKQSRPTESSNINSQNSQIKMPPLKPSSSEVGIPFRSLKSCNLKENTDDKYKLAEDLENLELSHKEKNMLSKPAGKSLSLSSCLKAKRVEEPPDKHLALKANQKPQHKVPSVDAAACPNEEPLRLKAADPSLSDLLSPASYPGLVLCGLLRRRKVCDEYSAPGRCAKYPKFTCRFQLANKPLYVEEVYKVIHPFDFTSPSPDDIVKQKQKLAFTRSDKEFVV